MKAKFTKGVALVLAVLMMVGAFAACSTSGASTTPASTTTSTSSAPASTTTASSAAPVTITMWWYPRYVVAGKQSGEFENDLVKEFNKTNPNVTVKQEMLAWDSGPEKVNVAITAKTAPDSVFDYPGRIIGYGTSGASLDITSLIPAAVKSDIPDSVWSHCTADGKIYMMPIAIAPVAMAVNKTMYKAAAADQYLPTGADRNWSTDNFLKALEALNKFYSSKNIAPLMFYAKNEQGDASLRMFMQNQGADFVSADHKSVVLNSDAGVAAFQLIADMNKKGYLAKGSQSLTSSDALDLFYQGKAATAIMFGSGNITTLNKMVTAGTAPKDMDIQLLCLPTKDGKQAKVEAQVMGFNIFDNKDSAKAKAMMDFILFQCAKPECVAAQSIFPVRKSMSTSTMGDFYKDANVTFLATLTPYLGDTGYTIKNYAKVRAVFYPELQALLTGSKDAKTALDSFVKNANPLLA